MSANPRGQPTMARFHSLRGQLSSRISLLLIVVLAVLGIVMYFTTCQVETLMWNTRQSEIAQSAAAKIGDALVRAEEFVYFSRISMNSHQADAPRLLQQAVDQSDNISEIVMVDPQGDVIVSAAKDRTLLANQFTLTQSSWFQKTIENGTHYSELQVTSDGSLYVVYAVANPDVGGVTAVRINMDVLWRVTDDVRPRLGKTGVLYIIDEHGDILSHTRREVVLDRHNISETPGIAAAVQAGKPTFGIVVDLNGYPVHGSLSSIPGSKWMVVTEISSYEYFTNSRTSLIVIIVLLVASAWLMNYTFQRMLRNLVLHPLEGLHNAAHAFSTGDERFHIPPMPNNEFGTLAGAFEQMVVMLNERQGMLLERNDQLSEEVDTRRNAEADRMRLNLELGERVRLRTIELECANEELAQEIENRKQAEARLFHEAFHDALTGLPNRSLFLNRLGHILSQVRRTPNLRFAVLYMDLDRFKVVNDSLGHNVGDELLIAIGQRLQSVLRTADTCARLGGDEFLVLVENLNNTSEAQFTAERILKTFQMPFVIDDHTIQATISIGIVIGDNSYIATEDVLRDADIALYRAKETGKNRFLLFDTTLRSSITQRMEIETDLRHAIANREFSLEYQPITHLKTGMVLGFEALLRWNSPVRGRVMPLDFIDIAEETGMILPIGNWALLEACSQGKRWNDSHEARIGHTISMHVNISGIQFAHEGFCDQVFTALSTTGFSPECLVLGITESVLSANLERTSKICHELSDAGVRLEVNDFGRGYSSLVYLQQFPISALKIDRNFLIGNPSGQINPGRHIVHTILIVASELGLHALAEGIETEEELHRLIEMDCNYGQGNLIAPPMTAQAVEMFLTQRSS